MPPPIPELGTETLSLNQPSLVDAQSDPKEPIPVNDESPKEEKIFEEEPTDREEADPSELSFGSKRRRFEGEHLLLEQLYSQWKEYEYLPRTTSDGALTLSRILEKGGDVLSAFLSARQQAKRKEVVYHKLPPSSRKAFQAAMKHEWKNINKLDAVELLSPEEAAEARKVWRIADSRHGAIFL